MSAEIIPVNTGGELHELTVDTIRWRPVRKNPNGRSVTLVIRPGVHVIGGPDGAAIDLSGLAGEPISLRIVVQGTVVDYRPSVLLRWRVRLALRSLIVRALLLFA